MLDWNRALFAEVLLSYPEEPEVARPSLTIIPAETIADVLLMAQAQAHHDPAASEVFVRMGLSKPERLGCAWFLDVRHGLSGAVSVSRVGTWDNEKEAMATLDRLLAWLAAGAPERLYVSSDARFLARREASARAARLAMARDLQGEPIDEDMS